MRRVSAESPTPGRSARSVARAAGIGALLVAWAAAAHYTSAMVEASAWGAVLGLAPFVVIGAGFAWRSPRRGPLLAVLAAALAGLAALWPTLERNVGWMYFVQHVGTNAFLCAGFGRTLAAGREPLCTGLAALLHPRMSPALARYTRGVTLAWTIFFGAVATVSVALFFLAPRPLWSAFANLLTLPLVGAMFAAEYAVRVRVLPPEERGGLADAARAYWQRPAPGRTAPAPPSEARS